MAYELPSKEKLREIAARQDAKEKKIKEARARRLSNKPSNEQEAAAEIIQVGDDQHSKLSSSDAEPDQRNYRGYRERREMSGLGLSASTRWLFKKVHDFSPVVLYFTAHARVARYRNSTQPMSRDERARHASTHVSTPGNCEAREKWKRAGQIAKHAENDDTSSDEEVEDVHPQDRDNYIQRKREAKAEREKMARTMGIEYFLEMVDQKHRYGSSLRKYHKVWQESDTKENFFYWLDFGGGKDVDLPERPRTRLDEERVRYLSREERQKYLVKIDDEGMLCWAKNGERISTSPEWKDSMEGIVPITDDTTPTWRNTTGRQQLSESSSGSDSDSDVSVGSSEDASRYVNQELHDAKGLSKLKHLSTNTIMNNLLRKTTKKNTWIFVCDTQLRIYIGIKQSGAFQHSSFLKGARILSAGLIRIKRGQLRRLSPLSGHYAPPASSFRAFVHSLKDEGADMSRVSISRAYAVLVGLEGYLGAKRSLKQGEQKIKDVIDPEGARKREEAEKDKSKSAQKEREILEAQAKKGRRGKATEQHNWPIEEQAAHWQ
ncbi:unnamed protein product [Aureobasidium uvarum]|uniref:IQ calmodulin-binding motif protein n=1 Tax=Aureobasidium uvarum TaxID=2773716 RepID=A0A9N8KJL1_9PEZI|nr:unnamed protein product [Aureobasidium uvarum]